MRTEGGRESRIVRTEMERGCERWIRGRRKEGKDERIRDTRRNKGGKRESCREEKHIILYQESRSRSEKTSTDSIPM